MKSARVWLFLCLVTPSALLPAVPSHAAQPATTVSDTVTASYEVAGLRVIHRRLAANEIVAVNLYLLGGSAQLDSATAGIESLLLRASELGTRSYPGRNARLAIARTGSRTVISAEPDWTMFGFRGLRTEFDSTWSVFADRVIHPLLEPAAVEIVRARMVRWARNASAHPDALADRLARNVAFAGHPYLHDPDGTEASLAGLTVDELRSYHAAQMVTSRMLIVVVGNIEREEIEAAINRTFANLPHGSYTWSLPATWSARKASVTVHSQTLPTNYILGYFGGPPSNSKDYQAFRIATLILGGIAFNHIRDNGLSYAASAPFLGRAASGGGIYVTTMRPDTTIRVFNATISNLQEHTVGRPELQRYYKGFITEYYSLNESNSQQADFLARHELLRGDWRLAGRYMDDIRSVQGTDIRRVARQYMKNIQYAYIGNPALVPEGTMTKH